MNSGTIDMTANNTGWRTPGSEELREIPLQNLIPQHRPFVMIDCLTGFNRTDTTTELLVKEDNIFYDEDGLSASGLIENIAQTSAARMGYINLTSGEPLKIGFIGAIRNLVIHRTPKAGELLNTLIRVREEVFSMTLVDAEVKSGDELLAEAEMKIAISSIDAR